MAKQIIGNADTQVIADVFVITGGASSDPNAAATQAYVDARADKTYIHYQSSPSSTWTVAHNLGKMPSVMVVDTADTVFVGDVAYTDNNNLVITFASPFSGKAYLN